MSLAIKAIVCCSIPGPAGTLLCSSCVCLHTPMTMDVECFQNALNLSVRQAVPLVYLIKGYIWNLEFGIWIRYRWTNNISKRYLPHKLLCFWNRGANNHKSFRAYHVYSMGPCQIWWWQVEQSITEATDKIVTQYFWVGLPISWVNINKPQQKSAFNTGNIEKLNN